MKKEAATMPAMMLIGLSARTNNQNEMNPQTSKIASLVGHYFSQQIAAQIPARKNPGVTLAVYTDYESDEKGDYTYFIGEEVSSQTLIPAGMQALTIPAAHYQRFTTPVGKMPEVVIEAWQQIWKMSPAELNGHRSFQADFEVYDQRAADPHHTSLDIYIGIK
ncbi:GyrI-like domain-containing protein [Aquicella lusitana]|uniref:Putative transcriptional regulator YdeE n=1 Tax=Aquicella lusitana TaxID=254246 RepID=A0A370G5H5_9COXI|nr:GyrI-like domain-containing protein [Aquicella lusitana]RDI39068.1 putative transcriptional regulator YdeE [Aquicella lusitana]VVC73675.1 hypothetical protein AQULUS_14220 [Aquicella lusitana]